MRNGWLGRLWQRSGKTPRLTRWEWIADILLALTMTAATLNSGWHHGFNPPEHDPFYSVDHLMSESPRDLMVASLTALPLAVRRRLPLAALWTSLLAGAQLGAQHAQALPPFFAFVSLLMLGYSAAIHSPYRNATLASLVAAVGILSADHDAVPALDRGWVPLILLVLAVIGANAVGNWKQRVHAMEAEQEAATTRAVEQERARIAAELHDVVTHNVSVMVVQAGAARKVLGKNPDLAREALLAVEESGRAAMAELRHVMGLLTMTSRGDDPAAGADLVPQPGLEQIPALIERIRSGGVQVLLTVQGEAKPLPSGVDLAAYRVVQEALTNAVKHAAGARVAVTLSYTPREVRVDVVDTGGYASATGATGNGRGLIGLRQRLAVYGGSLTAAPRPSGGYRVSALIPLAEAA